jgi:hypothetical protein
VVIVGVDGRTASTPGSRRSITDIIIHYRFLKILDTGGRTVLICVRWRRASSTSAIE